MSERSFYIIVYDVVNDKRRLKVAKELEAVGERVQYSVFEVFLTSSELKKLKKRLKKRVDIKEDSVRIYFLCNQCREKAEEFGVGEFTKPPEVTII